MVRLDNMQFFAYHGCLEQERRDGNNFSVDVAFDYDMRQATCTDDLACAVNYAEVYDIVKAQMAIPSNLLENLAWRIREAIFAAFPSLTFLSVKVTKYNPPVDGRVESSSVTIDR